MLKSAQMQGITDVVNTVHFQHPEVTYLTVKLKTLQNRLKDLQLELEKANIPILLHWGAEVLYFPNLMEIKEHPLLTMGYGKYMLIEFLPYYLPLTMEKVLDELYMSGTTPIIAHPERIKPIQEDPDLVIVKTWVEDGYLIQLDAGSIIGKFGKKAQQTAIRILKNGYYHLLGSDAYDNKERNFCLVKALWIGEKFTHNGIMEMVTINPQNVLNGNPVTVSE